ncbi:MAG TPA: peptidyl-prolyl cis-trans isomerase [Thermoguttaceae bacterium]|nr:peptidyl-prolyl cis-trans isomerase [Thermoguttaceae bacterium]
MQRQLYPALLLITIALAAAVYLRPTVGEELMALAGARGGQTTGSYGQVGSGGSIGLPARATVFSGGLPAASSQRYPNAQSAPWPVAGSGEAFAGDVPAGSTSLSPSYPEAGREGGWPRSRFGYSDQPPVDPWTETPPPEYEAGRWSNPLPGNEAARTPAGPSYPIAGDAGNGPPPGPTPGPDPTSGGAAQAWGDVDPVGRYPTAGSPSVPTHSERPTRPTDPGTSYGEPSPSYSGPPVPYPDPPSYPPYAGPPDYGPNAAQPDFGPSAAERDYRPDAVRPNDGPSVAGQDYRPNVAEPNFRPRVAEPNYGPNAGRNVAGTGYGPPPGRPYDGPPVTSPRPGQTQLGAAPPAIPEAKLCEGARVLAWVGDDVILASEVMPAYEEIMSRIPESQLAGRPQSRVEIEKKALIAKLLDERIQTSLIYQEAKRTIPEEGLPEIKRKIAKYFEEEELPKRMEKAGASSRRELDEKLRTIGSSIERAKRAFVQQSLAAEWLRQQNGTEPKISHEEMLDYYREHVADFETPARARWEKLTVRKPRYGDPREARSRLAQMGNQVMQGMSAADVLKTQPQGDLECEGGVQGWVTKDSLEIPKSLEEAIFGLPVGKPSQIFEGGDGFHIVRVLEREEFKRTQFEDSEIQKQIREKLRNLRRQEQTEDYLARLRKEIPVRTVFDDDPELAELRRQMATSRK